jgi:hypothetical protein
VPTDENCHITSENGKTKSGTNIGKEPLKVPE